MLLNNVQSQKLYLLLQNIEFNEKEIYEGEHQKSIEHTVDYAFRHEITDEIIKLIENNPEIDYWEVMNNVYTEVLEIVDDDELEYE